MGRFSSCAIFLVSFLPWLPAHAACSSPAAQVGGLDYDGATDQYMICNGISWEPLVTGRSRTFDGRVSTDEGLKIGYDTVCSGGDEGTIRYVSADDVWEYCDGSSWQELAAAAGNTPRGWIVLTQATYNGNLGGLSGADTKCLNELASKTWHGKSEAGTLTAARVKAFLCDSTTCRNLASNTWYRFAVAGSAGAGGTFFKTTPGGNGPDFEGAWSGAALFDNLLSSYWSNRAAGTAVAWGTTPKGTGAANTCGDWGSAAVLATGEAGTLASSGTGRWSNGTQLCTLALPLICMVNPE